MWVTWWCGLVWFRVGDLTVTWCDSEWGISLWHGVIQSGGSHCGVVWFKVGDLTVAWCDSEWGISLFHPGLVCLRVKGSHPSLVCVRVKGLHPSLVCVRVKGSHPGLVCFRVKGSRCLTMAWCVSGWRDLAVSPWLGVFQSEGISLFHPGLVCFRVNWLMITYIALFSTLLSRLTALTCGSTWETSFL